MVQTLRSSEVRAFNLLCLAMSARRHMEYDYVRIHGLCCCHLSSPLSSTTIIDAQPPRTMHTLWAICYGPLRAYSARWCYHYHPAHTLHSTPVAVAAVLECVHCTAVALHPCSSSDDLFRTMTQDCIHGSDSAVLGGTSIQFTVAIATAEALRAAHLWVSSTWDPSCSAESEVLHRCRAWTSWSAYT